MPAEKTTTQRTLDLLREEWVAPYREALERVVECADWYARCLEDVQDHRPVRGLDEAKLSHTDAIYDARQLLATGRSSVTSLA